MDTSYSVFNRDHDDQSDYLDNSEVGQDVDALIHQVGAWSTPATPDHDAAADQAASRATQLPTAAAPDFPAVIGWGLIAVYAVIMLDFVLFFTTSRMAALMVGVSAAYFAVYLATPLAFMTIERNATGRRDRISLGAFLKQGVETWTGHLSGREAIAQIFTIPVVLSIALFAIGIAWQCAR